MRKRHMALLCLVGASVLVAGACTPPPTSGPPANAAPVAVLDANPTGGPAPLVVTFSAANSTDSNGSIVSYHWDLGDGNTDSVDQLTHIYTADGTYTVTLTVTDNQGATGTETVDITVGNVNQPPSATAGADVTSGIAPLTVNFTSSASDADGTVDSIAWDFGDGGSSTDADPSHTYAAAGVYTASVTVTDDDGAVTSDSVTITASANQAPTAVATSDVNSGKAPLAVNFSGSSSTDPDNAIVSYGWDFGDSSTDTGETPSHTFAASGTYTVTLTVTDALGATDQTTLTIVVADNVAPIAHIQATPTSGHAPLEVNFDGTTSVDSDGTISAYSWDFGDGSPADPAVAPTHTYASAGTYTATLTVTDDNGTTGSDLVTINASVPNVSPTAVAQADVRSGPEDLTVNFDSSNSGDPDGTIASTVWDFGDGNSDVSASPTHTYTSPGTYTVTLTVTDDDGAIDTDSLQITVTANQVPTASASANPLTGKTSTTFNFDGSASTDPDGTIQSHAWDFGDGQTASGATPSHSYATTGTFTATLTVTDDDGGTDTDSVTITVNPNQAPTAAISANPQTGAFPLEVTFGSSASADPDGSIASVSWNFGDGGTSGDAAPAHTYTGAGTYTATLTVTDDDGATGSASVTITVVQDNDGDGFSPPTDCDDSDNTIHPGAADPLDGPGIDSNCDGVDGVLADTVFVDATGGADSGACGPLGSPCATIDQGVTNANSTNKGVVQVSSGSYGGFTLTGELTVRGGYESDFDGRLGTTTVTGNGTGVLANGTTGTATLADLDIDSGTPSGAGASAYGVRAVGGGTLGIESSNVTAQAGNAGTDAADRTGNAPSGTSGGNGTGGSSHGSSTGGSGGNAVAPGGSGGSNTGRNNGQPGANGTGGACGGAGGGKGYYGGSKGRAGCGGAAGQPGAAGSGGAASTAGFAAVFDADAGDGANGGSGTNGGAGGGGGAGGAGCDGTFCVGNWLSGGAGGGGGGGGAGGIGGLGGAGGGGSFAIYSVNTTVNVDSNTKLATADGGSGGDGGNGQLGGSGGASGSGGAGNCTGGCVNGGPGSTGGVAGAAPGTPGSSGHDGGDGSGCCNGTGGGGASGGAGGGGGVGGTGGGASGGPSIAMLNKGSGSITFGGDVSTQVTIGSGGSGGSGGNSGATGQAVKTLNVA